MAIKNYQLILLTLIFPFLITCAKKNISLVSDDEELINLTPITFDKNDNISPTLTKDGSQILFSSKSGRLYNIFLKITPFTNYSIKRTNNYSTDLYPSLSNSGNKFCYSSDQYGDLDIFILDVRSGYAARRITSSEEDDILPSWSPDDKAIAFSRFDKTLDDWKLMIRNLEVVGEKFLTQGINPVYSIDGKSIYFRRKINKYFTLWKYDLEQNKETLIYQNEEWGLGKFSINGSGNAIIFSNNKNSKFIVGSPETGFDLWLLDLANGDTAQLTNNGSNDFDPVYLENGKVFFVSNRLGNNNIWQFDLKGF